MTKVIKVIIILLALTGISANHLDFSHYVDIYFKKRKISSKILEDIDKTMVDIQLKNASIDFKHDTLEFRTAFCGGGPYESYIELLDQETGFNKNLKSIKADGYGYHATTLDFVPSILNKTKTKSLTLIINHISVWKKNNPPDTMLVGTIKIE